VYGSYNVAQNRCADAGYVVLTFKTGDRYNATAPAVRVCVPGLGYDPSTSMYRIAFCWNVACAALNPLKSSTGALPRLRAYVEAAPVSAKLQ
jgi:hypothetical protein